MLPKLELAIRSGLKIYDEKGPITEDTLKKIEEIMQTGYKKDVARYLNIDHVTLRKYRKKYPTLREAIERGENNRTKHFFMKKDNFMTSFIKS